MASADSENTTSAVPLKLLLDEKKNRVIAAAATSDFVDALLSFLTLPMGTIIRVTNQHPGSIGCLNNLYQSIQELSANKFSTEASRSMLLNPPNPCSGVCKNLKLNVDDTSNGKYYSCTNCSNCSYYFDTACCYSSYFRRYGRTSLERVEGDGKKFVKSEMTFFITDDLRVLNGCVSSLVHLLHEFNIIDFHQTVEISVDVGLDKVAELLKRTLLSKTPLTDVFAPRQYFIINAPIYDKSDTNFLAMKNDTTSDDESKLSIKLIYTEFDKEILVVETNESFVDFLFSLCTIPLGSLIKLLDGDTRLGCIDILYKTAVSMDPNFLAVSKTYIIDCGVHEQLKCSSMLLKITSASPKALLDPRNPNPSTECFGKFLKDNQLFSVSNNLTIKPTSSVSSISFLKGKNVRVDDIKVIDVAIGANEVLALVKASLTSSSALDVLKIFLEDRKPQMS